MFKYKQRTYFHTSLPRDRTIRAIDSSILAFISILTTLKCNYESRMLHLQDHASIAKTIDPPLDPFKGGKTGIVAGLTNPGESRQNQRPSNSEENDAEERTTSVVGISKQRGCLCRCASRYEVVDTVGLSSWHRSFYLSTKG